jgi:hypothetical protein
MTGAIPRRTEYPMLLRAKRGLSRRSLDGALIAERFTAGIATSDRGSKHR